MDSDQFRAIRDHYVAQVNWLVRRAGFAEVGTVWQHGDDRVLVAVR